MDITSAVTFLAASILICFGSLVMVAAMILINNLFAKYWKPIKFFMYPPVEYRFVPQESPAAKAESQQKTVLKG